MNLKIKQWIKRIGLWLGLIFMFTSCTFVNVQNISETNVRVHVSLPDGSASSKLIRPADFAEFFSDVGGRYTVSALPDDEYEALLRDLQSEISRRLFEEAASLSAADVAELVARLNEIDNALEAAAQSGAACTGSVPDFETAVVIISYDESQQKYVLTCS